MTLNEKAERAREMLESPIFNAAMGEIKARIVAGIESCPAHDHDLQHELVLSLQILKRIPEQLRRYVDEQTLVKHNDKQDTFMRRIKNSIIR